MIRDLQYWQDLALANRKVAEEAQAQRDKAVADADHFFVLSGKYLARANEVEAQRDKARNYALEEAAELCDEYAKSVTGAMVCAAAIRAMKVEK
jgi:hypothetical protein